MTAPGDKWNDAVVIVVSEFGRIAGPQVAVTQANLFQDRDWPLLTDDRALIGGALRKSHGLNAAQLTDIFPSAQPANLQQI